MRPIYIYIYEAVWRKCLHEMSMARVPGLSSCFICTLTASTFLQPLDISLALKRWGWCCLVKHALHSWSSALCLLFGHLGEACLALVVKHSLFDLWREPQQSKGTRGTQQRKEVLKHNLKSKEVSEDTLCHSTIGIFF